MTPRWLAPLALAGSTALLVALAATVGETHTPIRSKYTYNDDVFPILRARCAGCHVTGGVAPMSLMTYKEAVPWAESLRLELIAGHMPPWYAQPGFGAIRGPHTLSGRELDVLLVWASGGTPRGDADKTPPAVTLQNAWPLGEPDLALPMPEPFTLGADTLEATEEFVIPAGTTEDRWVRAVDLRPGTPALVRDATISISAPAAAKNVLAMWLPGAEPTRAAAGTGFRLPAGAALTLRVHYKKTWKYEGTAMHDQSTIGLYFAPDATAARPIEPFAVVAPADAAPVPDRPLAFAGVLPRDVQALALRPHTERADVSLQVEAVRPDGTRVPMIRLTGRPDWDRRYWFEQPVTLPRGTRVEVVATAQDPLDPLLGLKDAPAAPAAAPRAAAGPLAITLDVVPGRPKQGSSPQE